MKSVSLCLAAFLLLTSMGSTPPAAEALLQDLFPNVSSGLQRGMSTISNGSGGGSLLSGLGSGASSGAGSLLNSFPLVGNCDRIAYRGVAECLTNFRPSTIGSKGQCCSWRKYRACINGIRTGQSLASKADRCPSRSFSRSAINAISDRLAGWPVSQCASNSCKKSG